MALICAKLVSVPVLIDPASDHPFIVPKVLASHGLGYLLAGVVAALALQFGRDLIVRSWLLVLVGAYLVANLAATVLAVDLTLALYGTHARMLGLGSIADAALLCTAAALLVRRRAEVAAVVGSVLVASLVVLVYEFVQVAGKDPFSWSYDGAVTPFATLGQPTTLAVYLTIVGVAALALALSIGGLNTAARLALVLYSLVLVIGSATTGTRSGLVGFVTGGAVLVTLLWMRQSTRRARVRTALGVVGAGVCLLAVVFMTPLGARLTTTIQLSGSADDDEGVLTQLDPSSVSRLEIYAIALQVVRDRPILGYGPDNFVVGVPKYRAEGAPPPIRQSLPTSGHSWAAYVATSSGLLGLAIFVTLILWALVLAFKARSQPLAPVAAATLAAYIGAGLTSVTDVTTDSLLWLSIGAITAVTANVPEIRRQSSGSMSRSNRSERKPGQLLSGPATVVSLTLGVLLFLGTARAVDASRWARTSQEARLTQAAARSIEAGVRATQLDPGRAEYWRQLGLAYVGDGRWRDAGAAFDRALRLAPYDLRNITDLVAVHLILQGSGDSASRTRAVELADQATRVDPNNPSAHLTRATAMYATGNRGEAVRSIETALRLDPQSTRERLYITATQIYLDAGRAGDAIAVARQGRAILGVTGTPTLGYELARALLANGQVREALTEIDLVLSLQPNYAAAQRLRAEIMTKLRT